MAYARNYVTEGRASLVCATRAQRAALPPTAEPAHTLATKGTAAAGVRAASAGAHTRRVLCAPTRAVGVVPLRIPRGHSYTAENGANLCGAVVRGLAGPGRARSVVPG